MHKYLTLFLLVLTGCQTTDPVKDLGEHYDTVIGRLSAPPLRDPLSSRRLLLYIEVENKTEDEKRILLAAVENKESKYIEGLSKKIRDSMNEPIVLYGRFQNGEWKEYLQGVDFVVVVMSIYDTSKKDYVVLITNYGERSKDAIRRMDWSKFMKVVKVMSKAVKGF